MRHLIQVRDTKNSMMSIILASSLILGQLYAGEAAPKNPSAADPKTITAPVSEPKTPAPPSLYVRSGGLDSLSLAADDLTARLAKNPVLLANPVLKELIDNSPRSTMRFNITALLCQIAGGPERYTGAPVYEVFKKSGASDKEWAALTEEMKLALESARVSSDLSKEWLARFEELRKTLDHALASEPVEYKNTDKGFAISFPKNWDRKEGVAGSVVMAFAPMKENEKFQSNVAVIVEDLPIEATAAEYAKANAISGKKLVDFKINDFSPFKFGALECQRLTYTHKMGVTTLQVISLTFVQNKRAFVINCTSEASKTGANQPAFESICRTFRLNTPANSSATQTVPVPALPSKP